MHKSKKKSALKSDKIPKPIKIKKEKTEEDRLPHPMSHYLGDRLELVRQIFGTLKPKTITNLAPDFLKKKSLEEIEELCLNELLGISTKRLKSVINATKCPSDTESSEDSDVHNIEERVSLEEISSDSEAEGRASNATKKKTSGSTGGTKKSGKNGAEKNEADGQISVLELLELQARARAIRSQLALEPVTKVEVNSDGDDRAADCENKSNYKSKENHTSNSDRKERKRKSIDGPTTSKTKKNYSQEPTSSVSLAKSSNGTSKEKYQDNNTLINNDTTKKIKLKRNFRTKKDNNEIEKNTDEQKLNAKIIKVVKEEKRSRSPSPDVIPIVAEPETLSISDSCSESEENSSFSKAAKITTDNINSSEKIKVVEQRRQQEKHLQKENLTEPEDGEISENAIVPSKIKSTDDNKNATNETDKTSDPINSRNDVKIDEQLDNDNKTKSLESAETKMNQIVKQTELTAVTADVVEETNKTSKSESQEKQIPNIDTKQTEQAEDEDDQNDDVISIEGGDLETEMIEHLEDNCDKKTSSFKEQYNKPKAALEAEDDIISLGSSEEESTNKEELESWNARWLKSSKVSKVLAASKLGKRVRDKIKTTKHSKKCSTRENQKDKEENEKNKSSYTSKHEDGSIDQYKELLEIRQRKT